MKKSQIYLLIAICLAACTLAVLISFCIKFHNTDMGDMTQGTTTLPADSSYLEEDTLPGDTTVEIPTEETEPTIETVPEETEAQEDQQPATPPNTGNSSTTVSKPDANGNFLGYKYDSVFDMEDNVFIDALVYTGYNLEEHKADGMMWKYVLSKYKKGYGWLSNITFGGGSTGLETTAEGLPDIKRFEKGGLVCATFSSYVYFNYLPNVAKIDVSSLDLPEDTKSANSVYQACKKWLKKGYTYNIGFKATNKPGGIKFEPDAEIPIGSIIVFRNMDEPTKTTADHVTIYVGEKNGYHWVIQTGNKNGPEFCAVERFKFGPDPQWPLAVFATPTCIYDAVGEMNNK